MYRCQRTFTASCRLLLLLLLISCGGSSPKSTSTPEADFSLSTTPSTITLNPGGPSQQLSITATSMNSFTGTITLTIAGLPAGVTAQPSALILTPGAAQNITFTAASLAAAVTATLTLTGTSGNLTHSTTVSATVTPPPDFSLSVSPASLTLAGGSNSQVSVMANPINSFTGTVSVSVGGLVGGVTASPSTFNLTPGTAQTVTLNAPQTLTTTQSTVTWTGAALSLTRTTSLNLTVQAGPVTNAPDVTTYHYNNSRDGLNAKETILTQSNVSSTQFGKIGFYSVDGKVDAQPLYLANVLIAGQIRNLLYVATEHGSVFAFDADTGFQIWKTSVLGTGETTSDNRNCSQITPEIGITSTPVIDRGQGANGTIFVAGMSKDAGGAYHQRLHALDITTGAEISGSPTEITATYPGTGANSQNGNVIFDPAQYAERAGLLLLNGNIYMGWTSHCDIGLYTGWVMAYSESTLQQTQVLNLTPNGNEGSVWMSGDGLAADSQGNIYLLDANGTFDTALDANAFPSKGDYGNSMLKLAIVNGKLSVADYFESYNGTSNSAQDLDLGSGGELLLPDLTDAGGKVFHLIVGAGKDKHIYLANRDNLGKFNPANNPADSNIYQELPNAMTGMVYSTPAFFNGVLYYAADGDALKAFPFTNAQMATTPSSQTTITFAHPGPTPSISANGTQNGIVWALESGLNNPGVLHAYDPANLAHEFYNSNQASNGRDSFGNGNKFITPVIVNGKVYVGTQNGVAVFGLLSH